MEKRNNIKLLSSIIFLSVIAVFFVANFRNIFNLSVNEIKAIVNRNNEKNYLESLRD